MSATQTGRLETRGDSASKSLSHRLASFDCLPPPTPSASSSTSDSSSVVSAIGLSSTYANWERPLVVCECRRGAVTSQTISGQRDGREDGEDKL